jgi:hypothetical protein
MERAPALFEPAQRQQAHGEQRCRCRLGHGGREVVDAGCVFQPIVDGISG